MYTVAPACPSCSAMPLPIPRVAPVTKHTFPANDFILLCGLTTGIQVLKIPQSQPNLVLV